MNKDFVKLKPCGDGCPFRIVMNRLGDKWSVLIIMILWEKGILRFGELHVYIDSISLKVLTSSLKTLEQNGFISRIAYPEVPPRVEYQLTDLGCELVPYIKQLSDWANTNLR